MAHFRGLSAGASQCAEPSVTDHASRVYSVRTKLSAQTITFYAGNDCYEPHFLCTRSKYDEWIATDGH
jgi:hypothetical protein